MTWVHDLCCEKCGAQERVRTGEIYHYRFQGNEKLAGIALPVWCFDCAGIRCGEWLPAAERLAELLEEYERRGIDEEAAREKAEFLRTEIDPAAEYARELARLQAQLAWRLARSSAPRCLACGGTNYKPLEYPLREIEHPGCSGVFREEVVSHGIQGVFVKVDGEGRRLPERDVEASNLK